MSERPRPRIKEHLRRASWPMTIAGIAGLMGTLVQIQFSASEINREVDKSFPRVASFNEHLKAHEEILIFDQAIHDRIQQGATDIHIPDIANSSRVKQALSLIEENKERQEKVSALKWEITKKKLLTVTAPLGITSALLAVTGVAFLPSKKEQDRRGQLQSANPTA